MARRSSAWLTVYHRGALALVIAQGLATITPLASVRLLRHEFVPLWGWLWGARVNCVYDQRRDAAVSLVCLGVAFLPNALVLAVSAVLLARAGATPRHMIQAGMDSSGRQTAAAL